MGLQHILAASDLTIAIAPVVGAYLCLSAAGLLRPATMARFLADLCEHPAAMHAVGAIAFFVGAGLLSLHRHWATPAEITVNFVAGWWAFEGAGMLADPIRLRRALSGPAASGGMKAVQMLSILVGVYLLAVGFAQ